MKLVEDVTHHGEHDQGEVEQGPGQGRQDQPVSEPGEEQALGVGRTLGEQEQIEQQQQIRLAHLAHEENPFHRIQRLSQAVAD
jgi:broad specificity phosphatase PhoE